MKRFLAFFENLGSRYNYDDLKLNFGIINLSDFPELGLQLGATRIPAVYFLSDGRIHKDVTVQTRIDWTMLKKTVKAGVWKKSGKTAKKTIRDTGFLWQRLAEYKLYLRLVKVYVKSRHDYLS